MISGEQVSYSTSGTEATWKAGVEWQAIPALRFRASLSRDSRAPSLFELLASTQSSIGLLVDPRSGLTGMRCRSAAATPRSAPNDLTR